MKKCTERLMFIVFMCLMNAFILKRLSMQVLQEFVQMEKGFVLFLSTIKSSVYAVLQRQCQSIEKDLFTFKKNFF